MDGTTVGLLLAALITAVFAYATQKAASNAALRSSQVTSGSESEREAFVRARDHLEATIENGDRRLAQVVKDLDLCNEGKTRLRTRLVLLQTENEHLGTELGQCKQALRAR